jgi:hypothetical protein
MTVCKTFARLPVIAGKMYRKADVMPGLKGPENMAANYFDPVRDMICSFLDEESAEWVNELSPGKIRFRRQDKAPPDRTPPWERTKLRRVFLRPAGSPPGEYRYLGESLDETPETDAAGEWIAYGIL